jgi:hypothetical protein
MPATIELKSRRRRVIDLGVMCVLAVVFGPALLWGIAVQKPKALAPAQTEMGVQTESPANTNRTAATGSNAEVQFSAGISDILLLVNGTVGVEILKAFIQNSAIAYYPSAQEIIVLRQQGVPEEVIVALLQRGAALRAERQAQLANLLARTSTTAPESARTTPYANAAPPDMAAVPGYGTYPVVAPAYPAANYSDWWNNYGYPATWFYWPVGLNQHRQFRKHHPHFKHGFPGHSKGRQPTHWAGQRNRPPWTSAAAFHRPAVRQVTHAQPRQQPAFPIGPHWGANRFHPPAISAGPSWGANRGPGRAAPLTRPNWGANRGSSPGVRRGR